LRLRNHGKEEPARGCVGKPKPAKGQGQQNSSADTKELEQKQQKRVTIKSHPLFF
jgi:hypothetical protein